MDSNQQISDEKDTIQKLIESEERWRSITKYTPDHILMMDRDAKILFINYTVPDLSIDEVIGRPIFDFVPKEYQELHRNVYDELLNNGESRRFERGYVDKDGKQFYFEIHSGPVWKEGKVIGIINRSTDITERKITEQKLIESEERLKKLNDELEQRISERTEELRTSEEKFHGFVDFGNIGMAITSVDKKWVYCNDQICEILGFTREELLDKTWADISYPEDLQSDIDQFNKIIDGKIDSYQIDKRYIKKNGEIMYAHLTVSCIRNSDGTVKHFLATLQNITKRKKIQLRLIESEEKHRTFMETAKDFMHIINDKGKIIYANRDFIGYKKEELMEMHITKLIAEETLPIFAPELKNLIKNGRITLTDLYCKGKDGTKIIGELNVVAMYGPDGVFNGARGIFKDVTERKKIEQELKESEEKYRTLFESSKDGIIFSNMDGKIMDCNQAYLDMLGYTLVEIQEFSYQGLTPEKWHEMEADIVNNKLLSRGYSGEYEKEYIRKDGIIVPISINVWLIKDDQGNNKGMWAIVRNITERKKAEDELKELSKLKSEFLRRASHELKTPLISIKGFSDLILSLYADHLDPGIVSKLREINVGCERLQNIINNLLKTSRVESTELKPKLQKEDLSFLIKFCVHELESLAEIRKQSIKLDIHNDLFANIEKEEIHDVLSNLLTNAIKYTPPMGKIEIKTELQEDSVVVSVKDDGIGFTEGQKKKIFQQFGKIERYGQGLDLGIDGTGLGLYISKKIVESHGGKIWMESEGKSRGSTFYFKIPTV